MIDLDDLGLEVAKRCVYQLKQHKGVLLLLSSEPSLVTPMGSLLKSPLQMAALKPLDISRILKFLGQVQRHV